jgi:hypothetical protein
MNRMKNYYKAYAILFCIIFTLSLLGCAGNVVVPKPVNVAGSQNMVDRKPMNNAGAEIKKQTIEKETPTVKEYVEIDDQKEENKLKKDIAWGSQIRSYILHPYKMVKDHRTNLENNNANKVLDGDLDEFIQAYLMNRTGRS